jgi:hypothetical protein
MSLTQKIVASLIFPITEIIAIENHTLYGTFLHVTFKSQSLLKPTSDQTSSDTNRRTKGGDRKGGEWDPNPILLQELTYVPSSITKAKTLQEGDEHSNQQCRNDALKVMNAKEKHRDQLDTRLARYSQNRERTSG